MKPKVTQEHFELFVSECKRWQKKLELDDWSIVFRFRNLGNLYASVIPDIDGCTANISLCKVWSDTRELNNDEIKELAKHEMLHLMLAMVTKLGRRRFVTEDEFDRENEKVVVKIVAIIPDLEDL